MKTFTRWKMYIGMNLSLSIVVWGCDNIYISICTTSPYHLTTRNVGFPGSLYPPFMSEYYFPYRVMLIAAAPILKLIEAASIRIH